MRDAGSLAAKRGRRVATRLDRGWLVAPILAEDRAAPEDVPSSGAVALLGARELDRGHALAELLQELVRIDAELGRDHLTQGERGRHGPVGSEEVPRARGLEGTICSICSRESSTPVRIWPRAPGSTEWHEEVPGLP